VDVQDRTKLIVYNRHQTACFKDTEKSYNAATRTSEPRLSKTAHNLEHNNAALLAESRKERWLKSFRGIEACNLMTATTLTGKRDGWHAETAYSKRLKLTGSRGHVTLYGQNRTKLCRLRPWLSLMTSGGVQRERETETETQSLSKHQMTEANLLTRSRDFICAEPSKTRPPSSVTVTYAVG
jgi:hypothetical protein